MSLIKFIKENAWNWIQKNWMDVVNLIVIAYLFGVADGGWTEAVAGFWLFVLLGYYIFWKFFGIGKSLTKKDEQDD